jgi:hypothetical protein
VVLAVSSFACSAWSLMSYVPALWCLRSASGVG